MNVSHEAVIVFENDTIKFKNSSANKLFEHERRDQDEPIELMKLFSRREGGSLAELEEVEPSDMQSLVEINQMLLACNVNASKTLRLNMKHRDPLNQPELTCVQIIHKEVSFGESNCSLLIIKDVTPLKKLEKEKARNTLLSKANACITYEIMTKLENIDLFVD